MGIFALLSLFAFVECIVIGVYVFSKAPKDNFNRLFLFMCFTCALRAFVEYGYRSAESLSAASFWQAVDVLWPFASLSVFHFFIYLTLEKKITSTIPGRIAIFLLYGSAIAITMTEIWNDAITGHPVREYWGWTYSPGTVPFGLFAGTIFAYFLCFSASILSIIYFMKTRKSPFRKTAVSLALILSFIVIIGSLSEIFLPLFSIKIPETSNIATAIGFIPLAYLIWKKKIFSISPETAVDNILGSMRDSLILVNHEGKIRYVNQAASNLLEYTEPELMDKTFRTIIPIAENNLAMMGSQEGIQSLEGIQYLESAFQARSGKIIPVSISLSRLVVRTNTHTIGFVCIARDITERRKREAELAEYRHHLEKLVRSRTARLRENYQRYITLFQDSPSALVETDLRTLCARLDELRRAGCRDIIEYCMEQPLAAIRLIRHVQICKVNRALLQLFAIEGKHDFSKGLHMLLRKKSFVILMYILESIFNGDLEMEANGMIYRPDRSERFVILRLSMVEDGDPQHRRAIISIVDITAQKKAEEERAELEEQLRHVQKMEALGILAGGIAHDFNNLLTGIHGYADIVKHEIGPASPLNEEMDIIERTTRKAAGLVRQLLNFARKGKQHNVVFDVHMIIDEVMTILKHSIDKRIRIVRALDAEQAFIRGDPGQIEQVIVNLSVNACDAMPEGGDLLFQTGILAPTKRQRLAYPHLTMERYVSITVSDTGTGIPEEIRDRIFEPFFTTKEPGKGTGMGLAVVYGIIADHEGIIEVDANEGSGTVFRILLPLAEKIIVSPRPKSTAPVFHGAGRILVVDDEEIVCQVISKMLDSQGYSITVAHNGEEAIEKYGVEKDMIDMVLIDMVMPKMSGRDCFRAMRMMNPDVKAVLITGYLPEASAFEAITEGMRDVLFKPFSRGRLTEVINAVMGM